MPDDIGNDSRELTLATALGRLALSMAGWALIAGVAIAVVRLVDSPDAGRTTVMRLARTGERYAMYQARTWASIADSFGTVYEKARPINA